MRNKEALKNAWQIRCRIAASEPERPIPATISPSWAMVENARIDFTFQSIIQILVLAI
jgi:hypothetical protein